MADTFRSDIVKELVTLYGANPKTLQTLIDSDLSGGDLVGSAAQGIMQGILGGANGEPIDPVHLERELNTKGVPGLWLAAAAYARTPESAVQIMTGKNKVNPDDYKAIAQAMGLDLGTVSDADLPQLVFNKLKTDPATIRQWATAFQEQFSEMANSIIKLLQADTKRDLYAAMARTEAGSSGVRIGATKVSEESIVAEPDVSKEAGVAPNTDKLPDTINLEADAADSPPPMPQEGPAQPPPAPDLSSSYAAAAESAAESLPAALSTPTIESSNLSADTKVGTQVVDVRVTNVQDINAIITGRA